MGKLEDYIKSVKAREAKAVKGPWWKGLFAAVFNGQPHEYGENNFEKHMGVCFVGHENTNENEGTLVMEIKDVQDTADFIAHSRQDIPTLLKIVEAAMEFRRSVWSNKSSLDEDSDHFDATVTSILADRSPNDSEGEGK